MPSVCFYFQVHQPFRIKPYRVFDIGRDSNYWNDDADRDTNNERIFKKVARKSYLPANAIMLDLLRRHPEFRISFSLSGTFLDQAVAFAPEVIQSFRAIADTGRAEFLSETYHHSLSFLYARDEWRRQVHMHAEKIQSLFGIRPTALRNTELIYNDEVGKEAEALGYEAVLAEGADHILGWRSPNFLYRPPGTKHIALLLKNYRLSDDIAFRFSSKGWAEYPLSAEKFSAWVREASGGNVVNLFMDYETFGEHQWEDTGIFEFLRRLPSALLEYSEIDFVTVSEAAARYTPKAELSMPQFVSWADTERDLSAWRGNPIQHDALRAIYALKDAVRAADRRDITEDWRRLQTSDHFYYMCTKWWNDGDVHKYFSPYESPYKAFMAYMNAVHDLKLRINVALGKYPVV